MGIAEKLPPYNPPPWRLKNPIMEKACPAYYKNTAPEKAVETLDNSKIVDTRTGIELEKEIVYNGKGTKKGQKRTYALFLLRKKKPEYERKPDLPWVTMLITTRNNTLLGVTVGRMVGRTFDFYYKGKKIATIDHLMGFSRRDLRG